MQDHGYLSRNPRRPAVMVGVVVIHAVGVAGLMLFAPQFTQIVETTLEGRNIELPKDPLPLLDDARPTSKSRSQQEQPVRAKVIVPSKGADEGLAADPGPLEALGEGTGGGFGMEMTQIELPKDPVIVAPRFVGRNAQPPYPPGLQRMNIEGSVTVRVLVGLDGRPLRIEAVKVDQEAFFKATRDWAMSHWRFAPATRDGAPFEEWRTMTVTFRMND